MYAHKKNKVVGEANDLGGGVYGIRVVPCRVRVRVVVKYAGQYTKGDSAMEAIVGFLILLLVVALLTASDSSNTAESIVVVVERREPQRSSCWSFFLVLGVIAIILLMTL